MMMMMMMVHRRINVADKLRLDLIIEKINYLCDDLAVCVLAVVINQDWIDVLKVIVGLIL